MVKEKAYAKINLFLNVLRKRLDGFHDLEMVMAPLKLHDTLYFTKTKDKKITIESDVKITDKIEDNLVYKVAKFIQTEFNIEEGIKISIVKRIPMAGGLAGGSADAAATIRGLNRLFKLKMDYSEMAKLGESFGSDIPFCVYNKLALVKSKGEDIEFLQKTMKLPVLVVNPKVPVATKEVFENLDPSTFKEKSYIDLIEGIAKKDPDLIVTNLYNSLEPTTFKLHSEVRNLKNQLVEYGIRGVLMTGTGGTIFAISNNKKKLKDASLGLNEEYYKVLTKSF